MSHRVRSRVPDKTPIERIFEKVMRRKMTAQERIYLDITRRIRPPTQSKSNRQSRAA
jgi:hypothetical protein